MKPPEIRLEYVEALAQLRAPLPHNFRLAMSCTGRLGRATPDEAPHFETQNAVDLLPGMARMLQGYVSTNLALQLSLKFAEQRIRELEDQVAELNATILGTDDTAN